MSNELLTPPEEQAILELCPPHHWGERHARTPPMEQRIISALIRKGMKRQEDLKTGSTGAQS